MTRSQSNVEESETSRSAFIRELILNQIQDTGDATAIVDFKEPAIPRKLLRYWHDPSDLPDDVRECLASWDGLADEGFQFFMHDDFTAANYIARVYGEREKRAFTRCKHPAMRSDYLRLCFMHAEGGLYVDADDVLLGDGWKHLFVDNRLKLQPLCYDITAGGMLEAADIWKPEIVSEGRNFYVNNDPLAAPAGHPLLKRALNRATEKLLGDDPFPEIQVTTGPGNLTIAIAAHARQLQSQGLPFDFIFLKNWDSIAEMRWNLSYRGDERNWRNVYGC